MTPIWSNHDHAPCPRSSVTVIGGLVTQGMFLAEQCPPEKRTTCWQQHKAWQSGGVQWVLSKVRRIAGRCGTCCRRAFEGDWCVVHRDKDAGRGVVVGGREAGALDGACAGCGETSGFVKHGVVKGNNWVVRGLCRACAKARASKEGGVPERMERR